MSDPNEHQKSYKPLIVGPKRQMTIPPEMMKALRLQPGDAIEFVVDVRAKKILSAHPHKLLPIEGLSDEFLDQVRTGVHQLQTGEYKRLTVEELDEERKLRRNPAAKELVNQRKEES